MKNNNNLEIGKTYFYGKESEGYKCISIGEEISEFKKGDVEYQFYNHDMHLDAYSGIVSDIVQCAGKKDLRKVTCDEEAWLLNRVSVLVHLCIDINNYKSIYSTEKMRDAAIQSAIEAQSIEILRVLGIEELGVNIPKQKYWFQDIKRDRGGRLIN